MKFKHILFFAATGLLLSAGTTFAQVKKKPTPSPKSKPVAPAAQIKPQTQTLPVDPSLIKGTLPNGLTYYIRPTTAAPKVADLYLVSKGGSIVETDAQRGFAHLITHLAFKNTRDLHKEQFNDLQQKFRIKLRADTNSRTG